MKSEIETYYSRRASEYEKIYEKPEREGELNKLEEKVKQLKKECGNKKGCLINEIKLQDNNDH